MPQIKKVKSLQNFCLESIASNIVEWNKIHVEMFGDRKVALLDAKGPFDSLRKFCGNYLSKIECINNRINCAIISVSSINDSGENHWNPC